MIKSNTINRYDDQLGLKATILLCLVGILIGAILGVFHT